jgi:hypothetical protein
MGREFLSLYLPTFFPARSGLGKGEKIFDHAWGQVLQCHFLSWEPQVKQLKILPSKADKSAHDFYINLNGPFATENAGKHGHTLFYENAGQG